MKARAAAAFVVLAAAGATAVVAVGHASDALDGPRVTADPPSDVTDVFAFTSPEDPKKVVLAMAVTPYAGDAAAFSTGVTYAFRVQRVDALQPLTLHGTSLDVVCALGDAAPTMTCTAPDGTSATATVGDADGGSGSMRLFAGLRSDPAFFDRQGALATIGSGKASFTGQNAFAGQNVLAIVVELPSAVFADDSGAPPVLAVAAETVRVPQ
ncbi:MAG TPA: DUF4331 family protein [Polyangiaceae bacterium]|jgi:hypothetical protein